MCLVGIDEEILFQLGDVFVLVVGVSGESRQRGEGDNDIWMGLVEMGKELVDTIGLALPHHHSLRTIRTLTRHRKLEPENYDENFM